MYINLYTLKYISWLLSIPFVKLLNQYNPLFFYFLLGLLFGFVSQGHFNKINLKVQQNVRSKIFGKVMALTNFISPKDSTFKFISASLAN